MNHVEARVERDGTGLAATFGGNRIAIDPGVLEHRPALAGYVDRPVMLGIRPEDMEDAALHPDAPTDRRFRSNVELREDMGSEVLVHLRIDAPPIVTEDVKELAADRGEAVELGSLGTEDAEHAVFVARFDADTTVAEGDNVEVFVDTRGLHFFDADTRESIWTQDRAVAGAST
jgi:multiple sugar transport system ATP-binding protein